MKLSELIAALQSEMDLLGDAEVHLETVVGAEDTRIYWEPVQVGRICGSGANTVTVSGFLADGEEMLDVEIEARSRGARAKELLRRLNVYREHCKRRLVEKVSLEVRLLIAKNIVIDLLDNQHNGIRAARAWLRDPQSRLEKRGLAEIQSQSKDYEFPSEL